MTSHLRRAARGFTLIEILIVVVILGILAAVIIPQFTNAADDAGVASARTQLQTMRSQIELFRAQSEDGAYPSATWEADLEAGGYLRSATVNWPSGFSITDYDADTGDLTLEYDGSMEPAPDPSGW
jgi:prepilin-type N-terminal cleavage/methylation domain-containing protein